MSTKLMKEIAPGSAMNEEKASDAVCTDENALSGHGSSCAGGEAVCPHGPSCFGGKAAEVNPSPSGGKTSDMYDAAESDKKGSCAGCTAGTEAESSPCGADGRDVPGSSAAVGISNAFTSCTDGKKTETPICDFIRSYEGSQPLRLHMPGHKGGRFTGCESGDITEIDGADSLYSAGGIIKRSEEIASRLFGSETFYSAEGSSLCIRAMLWLTLLYAHTRGERPVIAAGRNAHKTFISAAALMDTDVVWLCGSEEDSYLSCTVTAEQVESALVFAPEKPTAVYLTSPDYLGGIAPVAEIAQVCRRHGVLLLVDNAHGAYLNFLPEASGEMYPIRLGADMCCDSAHKTLPVLTGGAYLHISENAPVMFSERAKDAMSLFGSTSPSYLILRSLDCANAYLADYPQRLAGFLSAVELLRREFSGLGFGIYGSEPLKLTLMTKQYGYTGTELAALLAERNIHCEFADPDFLVMMLTPEIGHDGVGRLLSAVKAIPRREVIDAAPPRRCGCERIMSLREAIMSPCEDISAEDGLGRIAGAVTVSCPPAVPIVMCGERINESAVCAMRYYGIERIPVVRR